MRHWKPAVACIALALSALALWQAHDRVERLEQRQSDLEKRMRVVEMQMQHMGETLESINERMLTVLNGQTLILERLGD